MCICVPFTEAWSETVTVEITAIRVKKSVGDCWLKAKSTLSSSTTCRVGRTSLTSISNIRFVLNSSSLPWPTKRGTTWSCPWTTLWTYSTRTNLWWSLPTSTPSPNITIWLCPRKTCSMFARSRSTIYPSSSIWNSKASSTWCVRLDYSHKIYCECLSYLY